MWQEIIIQLLNWPFLFFLFLCIFIFCFYDQVKTLINRQITIKWGDKLINIRELPEELKKEIEPLRVELNELQQSETHNAGNTDETEDQLQKAADLMRKALSGKWKGNWRSLERLSFVGKITEANALALLMDMKDIQLSDDSAGRKLARLKSNQP